MELTEHYKIAKHGPFGEGEALSAYSIINPAMDTIDDILWEHKGLIDDLEDRMDNAESELVRIENKFDTAVEEIHNELTRIENKFDEAVENINQQITEVNEHITNVEQQLNDNSEAIWKAINNILVKIAGDNSADEETGEITWEIEGNIAIGNMSLFGNAGLTSYIRARTGTGADDVRAQ